MIDITLIGTASLFPTPNRALTAAFLSCGGHSILFDCGEGTQAAASKAGVSLMNVDVIALTHYHGDHVFGLPGLLQTIFSIKRTKTLYITGPEGLQKKFDPLLKFTGRTFYPCAIELIETPADGLKLSELTKGFPVEAKLTAFETVHSITSQGYCFTLGRAGKFLPQRAKELGVPVNQWSLLQRGQSVQIGERVVLPEQVLGEPRKGLKFVFTGDTTACDTLVEAAAGADLMICEATYGKLEQAPHAVEHGRHMTFALAAQAAAKAGVKQLWLAHYSHMITDPQDYLHNATAFFANTICGHDGLSTTLRFED